MNIQEIFRQRRLLSIEAKIQWAMNTLKDWYDYWDGDVYLALSGGKDSQVVGEILDMMGGKYAKIPRVFSNTGLEMPEIVRHVRGYLAKERGWNVVEVRPKKTYQEVWQEEGIPLVSKKVARQIRTLKAGPTGNGDTYRLYDEGITSKGYAAPNWKLAKKWRHLVDNPEIKTTEKCCDYLKKDPMKNFEKETGLKGRCITGMMADEGGYRSSMTKCNTFEGKTTRSTPLVFWTDSDIWEFVETRKIRICEVYYTRVYNDDGEMVATDWPFNDMPTWDEFQKKRPLLNCLKTDDSNRGYGSYAVLEDWKEQKRRYYMIRGEKRTGCMFCAFGAHLEKGANRFQRMSISHPRQHAIIMDRIGMRSPLELIDVKVTFD